MFNMHVLCFDVTALNTIENYCSLVKTIVPGKQYLLFQINGRISGDNAVSHY